MLSNNLSKTYLCGGYLRLSKEDGDVAGSETLQSNSIENQKEYIEDYIHSKPCLFCRHRRLIRNTGKQQKVMNIW